MPWLLLLIPAALFGLVEISKPSAAVSNGNQVIPITWHNGPLEIPLTFTRAQLVVALLSCSAVMSSFTATQIKAMTNAQIAELATGLQNTCWPGDTSGGGISAEDVVAAIAIYEAL